MLAQRKGVKLNDFLWAAGQQGVAEIVHETGAISPVDLLPDLLHGQWWRLQAGARGVLQRRQIGNPSAQAERNARLLRRYLAAQLGAWAKALPLVPIVVFTHPHAMLDADDAPIPVVHLRQLPALLQIYSGDRLDSADVSRVVTLLTCPSPSNDQVGTVQ